MQEKLLAKSLNSCIIVYEKCIRSSGQGVIPYRRYLQLCISPRAGRHDLVRIQSRQYSLDERRVDS